MTVTQSSTLQRDDAFSCSRKKSVGADLINVGENCIILIKLSAPQCATNANKQKNLPRCLSCIALMSWCHDCWHLSEGWWGWFILNYQNKKAIALASLQNLQSLLASTKRADSKSGTGRDNAPKRKDYQLCHQLTFMEYQSPLAAIINLDFLELLPLRPGKVRTGGDWLAWSVLQLWSAACCLGVVWETFTACLICRGAIIKRTLCGPINFRLGNFRHMLISYLFDVKCFCNKCIFIPHFTFVSLERHTLLNLICWLKYEAKNTEFESLIFEFLNLTNCT